MKLDLSKFTFNQTPQQTASILTMNAIQSMTYLNVIIENQIKIISKLESLSEEQVSSEIDEQIQSASEEVIARLYDMNLLKPE